MPAVLERYPLFSGLDPELLCKWEEFLNERYFAKRQIVQFPLDCREPIYFVKFGRIKVSYVTEEGKEFSVAVLGAGEVYSVHSLAQATTLEDSAVHYLGMTDFLPMLEESPELEIRLIRVLGRILRQTNDVILDLAFREAAVRLAHVMLREGQQGGKKQPELPFSLGFTHEELASLSGATRQTVTEILKRWERQGIVALKRGKLSILSWESLMDKL